jgi:hypothetical protein
MSKFIDFGQATISGRRQERGAPVQRRELLGSVVYRPSTSGSPLYQPAARQHTRRRNDWYSLWSFATARLLWRGAHKCIVGAR